MRLTEDLTHSSSRAKVGARFDATCALGLSFDELGTPDQAK